MEAQAEARVRAKQGLNWPGILWISLIHVGVLAAPFTFSWSGLAICVVLYFICGFGITLGYHRLITHRSFRTPRWIEYILATMGILANQGGPLKWAAAHRRHHVHSDEPGVDPHTPRDGTLWAHMLWFMHFDKVLDHPDKKYANIKDLAKDPYYQFLDRFEIGPPLLLAVLLYVVGELVGGLGLSWLVWGMSVRSVFLFHATWLVNSATHMWGYRNFETKDLSRNLWWVALITFGEGWHNNHHAYQRSAAHGLRWWELDMTYLAIRSLSLVGLAREIYVAPAPTNPNAPPRCKVLRPRRTRRKAEVSVVS